MKRLLGVIVISALLVGGGLFAFAGVSRAAGISGGATATTWIGRCGQFMDSVGELLGLDRATVMTRRHNGESLAGIAADQGVAEQDLISKLEAQHIARIQGLVDAGRLTQAQADAYLADIDQTIKANIERTTIGPSATGMGMGMGLGMGLGRGADRGGCGGFGWGRGAGAANQNPGPGTR